MQLDFDKAFVLFITFYAIFYRCPIPCRDMQLFMFYFILTSNKIYIHIYVKYIIKVDTLWANLDMFFEGHFEVSIHFLISKKFPNLLSFECL